MNTVAMKGTAVKTRAPKEADFSSVMDLEAAICRDLGVDPMTVLTLALVLRAGDWPAVIIKRRLWNEQAQRVRVTIERHHIIAVKASEREVSRD